MQGDKTTPITLTAEQIISLVGHGVTQEQLDSVRRELGGKIDDSNKALTAKIDSNYDKLDAKIDAKFNMILMFLLANVAAIVTAVFWLGSKIGV